MSENQTQKQNVIARIDLSELYWYGAPEKCSGELLKYILDYYRIKNTVIAVSNPDLEETIVYKNNIKEYVRKDIDKVIAGHNCENIVELLDGYELAIACVELQQE